MIQDTRTIETTQTGRMPGVTGAAYEAPPTSVLRLSWGALIAGTVVAIATQAILAVLGLAIGLSLAPVGAEGFAIGAGIWWLLTAIIALFVGGYIAGRFSYIRHPFHSSMHGVMTWCLVTVLSIVFIGLMGGVVAAGPMGAVVEDLIPQQQQQIWHEPGTQPGQVGAGQQQQQQVDALPAEIDPGTAAGAAWWTFFALLLGVTAAGLGGYLAAPQNLRETEGMKGTAKTANDPDL